MKLNKRYLRLWRHIQSEEDTNVLMRHLLNNTWAVHTSTYSIGKASVELHDGKKFYGSDWNIEDVRKLYRDVLAYMRKKGWKP